MKPINQTRILLLARSRTTQFPFSVRHVRKGNITIQGILMGEADENPLLRWIPANEYLTRIEDAEITEHVQAMAIQMAALAHSDQRREAARLMESALHELGTW